MPKDEKPPFSLDDCDIPEIDGDNFQELLDPIAFKATYAAMKYPEAFPMGKIAALYLRNRGIYSEQGGGVTNNFFQLVLNASPEQLNEIKEKALAAVGSGTTQNCRGGVVETRDSGKSSRQPALLAPKSHQNIR